MIVPYFPLWIVDVVGAMLMILLSLLCLGLVRRLKRRDQENVIWTYLLWVCYGLVAFAVSRSAGHILKQVFLLFDRQDIWRTIRPYTGAVNTFMFVFVASVTLFFERVWRLYQQVLKDKCALQDAHGELLYLNQHLEELVKERTAALVASERRYRSIFESSQDMIMVCGRDGRMLDLNPAGYRMLGINQSDKDAQQRRFQEFLFREADWAQLLGVMEKQGFVASAEADLVVEGGRPLRALISGTRHRSASRDQTAYYLMVKNIEKQHRMREQMARAEKLASIGELSAGIAHEINNPLGIILGYTQLLLRGEAPASERHGDLKTIEKHVRSCKSIVENLLSFARSETPRKVEVNLHDAIDEVLNFIQRQDRSDPIEIITDYDQRVPRILLEERKIKQVLMNLVMNARHAVGSQGTITLATRYDAPDGRVVLTVNDTGCGIEKQNLDRIFDPFFTTKPTGEGTGLGLSVSYGIVKNHGGDIHVESSPGSGTTFSIDLPVTVDPHARRDAHET